ncbi:multidrug transporter [Alteromonas halophila]|uniref:Multidrug transporter n=2 Tax=Alteromonas halophila TaxID=516698 RepID=A0A918MXN3_9ALTE|nr:multidrug transporter [Alteromonas halophila]
MLMLLCLLSGATLAKPVTLSVPELVNNIKHAHPYIAAMHEQGVQKQLMLTQSESVFDPRITQQTSSRVSGYYDGAYAAQQFVQPLQSMNARLYSEYRISDGDFPVYEGQYETLSGGEASVGVALSLLRDREIDKDRVSVSNARLAISQWQAEFAGNLNETLYKGISHYLYWLGTALQVESVTALLDTATSRKKGFEERVKQGDLAQADLIEFEANLLQQELLLTELKRELMARQVELAFYVRDQQGEMVSAETFTAALSDIQWPYDVTTSTIMALKNKLSAHPAVLALREEARMLENKQRLADNALLPKLDIKASVARDVGSGPASLDGTEGKLGLSFSYPLGNRSAKAQASAIKSKRNEFAYKQQLMQDKVTQAFNKAYRNWQQATQAASLNQKNATLADRLYDMELKRYNVGDSDMFVLNARESARIKAQMKKIKADIDVYMAELALHYAAADLLL